jgi:integrase
MTTVTLRVPESMAERLTSAEKAPVPVISPLAKFLEAYRLSVGNPQSGWMFASGSKPLHLDNLARRVIAPIFEKAGLPWHGWRAFRRGLATNLQRLGVPIKTAQALLRQADFATAANYYANAVEADSVEAMRRLEKTVCNKSAMGAFAATNADIVN